MNFLFKSIFVLGVALSIPLAYRQFADDKTVAYMSKHITNYKQVDKFLRDSATKIDKYQVEYSIWAKKTYEEVKPHLEINALAKRFSDTVNYIKTFVNELLKEKKTDGTKAAQQISDNQKLTVAKSTVKPITSQTGKSQKKPVASTEKSTGRLVTCKTDASANKLRLFSKDELAKKKSGQQLFLAFTGLVYDVSKNSDKYGPGKEYSAFAGRDATRAYLTGDFKKDLSDDISDVAVDSKFSTLQHWSSFYQKTYPLVGRVEGFFYDADGCPTKEVKNVQIGIENISKKEQEAAKLNVVLPECNSEYNAETQKSRVWCTVSSGGVERSWFGVPRIYQDVDGSKRCVCYSKQSNVDQTLAKKLKIYPNCDAEASECNL